MFARAVRSSCGHLPQRPQGLYGLARISNQNQLRILTTSRSLRDSQKTGATSPIQSKTASIATDSTKKGDGPGVQKLVAETKSAPKKKTEDILNTSAATNKEQRKADWAIMKDLAKYLWPKVRVIDKDKVCGILAKLAQGDWGTKLRVGTALTLLIGAKVMNSLSLQQNTKI